MKKPRNSGYHFGFCPTSAPALILAAVNPAPSKMRDMLLNWAVFIYGFPKAFFDSRGISLWKRWMLNIRCLGHNQSTFGFGLAPRRFAGGAGASLIFPIILILSTVFTNNVKSQVPYVSAPTNSPVDGYAVIRSGTSGGHNKWAPGGQFVTNGVGIALTTNGQVITITATGTNAASVTNVILRPGPGVDVTTNAPTDWTVSDAYWKTNSSDGSFTNVNVFKSVIRIASSQGGIQVSNTNSTALFFKGMSNSTVAFNINGSGDINTIKGLAYNWPATNANDGQYLRIAAPPNGQLNWGDPVGAIAFGTNIVLQTNGTTITVNTTNEPVFTTVTTSNLYVTNLVFNGTNITNIVQGGGGQFVSAGTNITMQTNGSVVTVNASGGGGGVGPGTVPYIPKWTSTTNIGDSQLIQANTNLLEFRVRAQGTGYTNQITNNWISQQYANDTTNEGLRLIVAGTSALGAGHELTGYGVNFGVAPIVINKNLIIEPGSTLSAISGHTTNNVYPTADNQGNLGTSSSRWASVRTGIRGYAADPYTNSGTVLTFSAGGSGFGVAADTIDVWQSSGPSKALILFTNNNGGAKTVYGANGGIAIGDVLGTPNTFLTHNALDVANTWQMGTNHNSATTRGPSTYIHGVASDDNAANRAGGNAYFVGGPASGNGTNGSVGLATYNKGSSGFGYNTVVPRVFAAAVPVSLTTNSATLFLNITLPTALKSMGGIIHAHTEIGDGTDVAAKDEDFAWTAIRKSTTVTTAISASANNSTVASGALAIGSTTFTAVANAQTVDLKCNLVTTGGLATTANIMYTISFNSTAASSFVEQ